MQPFVYSVQYQAHAYLTSYDHTSEIVHHTLLLYL